MVRVGDTIKKPQRLLISKQALMTSASDRELIRNFAVETADRHVIRPGCPTTEPSESTMPQRLQEGVQGVV